MKRNREADPHPIVNKLISDDLLIFDTDSSDDDECAPKHQSPNPNAPMQEGDEDDSLLGVQEAVNLFLKPSFSMMSSARNRCAFSSVTALSATEPARTPSPKGVGTRNNESVAELDDPSDEDVGILEAGLLSLFQRPSIDSSSTPVPIVSYLLRTYLGISSGTLRDGQEEVIRSILCGVSTLAVFPTGWGKSLCYQLPALVHRLLHECTITSGKQRGKHQSKPKFSIVVSPLLALIADQLGHIKKQDSIVAVTLSSQTSREHEERLYKILVGDNPVSASPQNEGVTSSAELLSHVDLIFLSPEAFVTKKRFRDVLRQCLDRVAFVCIDEAHCISEWSHDFRPAYLHLKKSLDDLSLGSKVPPPPVLALTATATPAVRRELTDQLCIRCVVDRMAPRTNLAVRSVRVDEPAGTSDFIKTMKNGVSQVLNQSQYPALVYAPTQALVDDLAVSLRHELSGSNHRVFGFHAGLPQALKSQAQREFLSGGASVLVATIAFGMGIDKRDIRTVVHCGAPGSLAAYSQESGRAGRDGEQSQCIVVYDPSEYFQRRKNLYAHFLSFQDTKRLVQSIVASPVTMHGPKQTVISAEQISGELGCPVETVETMMYLMILSHPRIFASLEGKISGGFRVVRGGQSDLPPETSMEQAGPAIGANEQHSQHYSLIRKAAQQRKYGASLHGVLQQLDVKCEVEALCRNSHRSASFHVVAAANQVRLPLDDFDFRLKALEEGKAVMIRRFQPSFLVRCGPDHPPSEAQIALIAKELFFKAKSRISRSVDVLRELFEFLDNPSQESMVQRLGRDIDSEAPCAWQPPPPSISKLQAVDIVADFIQENKSKLHDTHEAVKALMGVVPSTSSSFSSGSAGGLTPLTGSWYLRHPHFGALREFDFDWIWKVVAAHGIDPAEAK